MQRLAPFLLDLIFPTHCLSCNAITERNDTHLCSNCIENIINIEAYCIKCGSMTQTIQTTCTNCYKKNLNFKKNFSLFSYDSSITKILKKLKFTPSDFLMSKLDIFYNIFSSKTKVLAELDKCIQDIDFIIPVPIHKNRLAQRGYNQAEVLANIFAKVFNLVVKNNILKKEKNTRFMFGLKAPERAKELSNAFKVSDSHQIKDKNILVFDDISTTGVTLNTIAQILKKNGAKHVYGFSISKTS
ncbi:MAG: ComF family protein [bacterium]|nr:ComF family protein [bacterium]